MTRQEAIASVFLAFNIVERDCECAVDVETLKRAIEKAKETLLALGIPEEEIVSPCIRDEI